MSKPASHPLLPFIKGAVQAALGLGLVGYLVWSNWESLHGKLSGQPIRASYLVLGAGVCLAAVLITFFRWYLLVKAQGLPFRVRDALRIGFIGYFFNLLIPGAVGGDLVKAVLLAREQQRRTLAIATVVMDRFVGLLGLVLLGGLVTLGFWDSVRASPELSQLGNWTLGILAAACAGTLLVFSRRMYQSRLADRARRLPVVGGVIGEALQAMHAYRSGMGVIWATLLMSLAGHFGFVLALRCAMLALPEPAPPASVHFLIAPLGLMVGAIPITPGGLGLAEGAMQRLFIFSGSSGDLALVMMLAFRMMQLSIALLGLLYYLASRRETQAAVAAARAGAESPEQPLLLEHT